MPDLVREQLLDRIQKRAAGERLDLRRSGLREAFLEGVDLREANLEGADLEGANLRNANLAGANLTRTNLDGADLTGANLVGARLVFSQLESAKLGRARLERAILRHVVATEAYFAGAVLSGADLTGAHLVSACLDEIEAPDAKLEHAILENASLSKARLTRASFLHANLQKANLSDAELSEIDARHADLTGARLEGAVLTGARIAHVLGTGLPIENVRVHWIDTSARGDGSERLTNGQIPLLLAGRAMEPASVHERSVGRGDVIRDAELEFAEGASVRLDGLLQRCSITLGRGATLTIGEHGLLLGCSIRGEGRIVVLGKFFEAESPGIVGATEIVVRQEGVLVAAVEQHAASSSFAFEPGSRLRVRIKRPNVDGQEQRRMAG